jgi:hypothetical protein
MGLAEELIGMLKDDGLTEISPGLVKLVQGFLSNYDQDELIQKYIKYSHELWEKIYNKDEDFFISDAKNVFRDLPMGEVDAFKALFETNRADGTPAVTSEDRDDIWVYFFSFNTISIKYIHEMRGPVLMSKDGKMKPGYKNRFFPDVKLIKYSKLYGVELTWNAADD